MHPAAVALFGHHAIKRPWSITSEWAGATVFCIGGGPSLEGFDGECLRGAGHVIAINEAGLTMTPWADVHYFPDWRYIEWNIDRLELYEGPERVTRAIPASRPGKTPPDLWARIQALLPDLDVRCVARDTSAALSMRPGHVSGVCGGGNAINMAAHRSAARIVLLGYDMKTNGNYHDQHKGPEPHHFQVSRQREAIEKMAPHLAQMGIEVLNATPGSALECFPKVDLESVL